MTIPPIHKHQTRAERIILNNEISIVARATNPGSQIIPAVVADRFR